MLIVRNAFFQVASLQTALFRITFRKLNDQQIDCRPDLVALTWWP